MDVDAFCKSLKQKGSAPDSQPGTRRVAARVSRTDDDDKENDVGSSSKDGNTRRDKRDRPPQKRSDMREILEDVRIGMSQLMSDARLDARERNLIFSVAPKAPVREFLAAVRKDWHDTRPDEGAHPKGEIHVFTWQCLLAFVHDGHVNNNFKLEERHLALLTHLRDDKGASVARFFPLSKGGRPAISDKPWLWQFRCSVVREHGMEIQRRLLAEGSSFLASVSIEIRNDSCPIRKIEKRIGGSTVL